MAPRGSLAAWSRRFFVARAGGGSRLLRPTAKSVLCGCLHSHLNTERVRGRMRNRSGNSPWKWPVLGPVLELGLGLVLELVLELDPFSLFHNCASTICHIACENE